MSQKSHVQKVMRLKSLLRFRMKVLVAGVLGGGTMIAFPAASAAVVIYVALALGTIGMLAWTGVSALAAVAVAALLLPVLIVAAVLAVVAGVRRFMRTASSPSAIEDSGCGERNQALQEKSDDWETDSGPRSASATESCAAPDVAPSEGEKSLAPPANRHGAPLTAYSPYESDLYAKPR